MTQPIDRPGHVHPHKHRRGHFALCLVLYTALSFRAIQVGARHLALLASPEELAVATAVGWVTGALVAAFNLTVALACALLAILVMGFLRGTVMRPLLIFDAYWVVAFSAITPLSVVALDLFDPAVDGSLAGFDVLISRVQFVSIAALTLTVVYVWWFLRGRFDKRAGDAALSTLVGVAASYACLTAIHVLGSMLGLPG